MTTKQCKVLRVSIQSALFSAWLYLSPSISLFDMKVVEINLDALSRLFKANFYFFRSLCTNKSEVSLDLIILCRIKCIEVRLKVYQIYLLFDDNPIRIGTKIWSYLWGQPWNGTKICENTYFSKATCCFNCLCLLKQALQAQANKLKLLAIHYLLSLESWDTVEYNQDCNT